MKKRPAPKLIVHLCVLYKGKPVIALWRGFGQYPITHKIERKKGGTNDTPATRRV